MPPVPRAPVDLVRRVPAGWRAHALLVLLVAIAFANALADGFAFDDEFIIVRNRLLERPTLLFVRHIWAGTPVSPATSWSPGRLYRPLVMASYALNRAVGGLHPLGYHLVNVLLHAGVSVALYGLARRLGTSPGGALAAAAVFAVHPLHTEAVTGVVGRAEVLMALGVLLAVRCHLDGRTPAAVVAFIVALLSKEQAVVLPALLPLADLVARPGPLTARVRRGWPSWAVHAAVLGGYLLLRQFVLGGALGASITRTPMAPFVDNPLAHLDRATRVASAIAVSARYLWLLVWPARLSADYSFAAIPGATSLLDPLVLAGLAAWGVLLAVGVAGLRAGIPAGPFGAGLTALAFLPASNLLLPIGTLMGERLFYLPSAGVCLLLGAAWDIASRSVRSPLARRAAPAVLAAVLAALTARTMVRNVDWRDTRTLMESAARVVPGSAKVWNNLARIDQDPAAVVAHAERALTIFPAYRQTDPSLNLSYGTALLRVGRIDDAVDVLQRAVALDPTSRDAALNLGHACTRARRWPEAETAYRRAIALDPRKADAYSALSLVLRAREEWAAALAAAGEAVRLDPGLAMAHYNQARAAEGLGHRDEAVRAYEAALRLDPQLTLARERLRELGR